MITAKEAQNITKEANRTKYHPTDTVKRICKKIKQQAKIGGREIYFESATLTTNTHGIKVKTLLEGLGFKVTHKKERNKSVFVIRW